MDVSDKKAKKKYTPFQPMFHFYDPWKHRKTDQKTGGFLIFAGGTGVKHWLKMKYFRDFVLTIFLGERRKSNSVFSLNLIVILIKFHQSRNLQQPFLARKYFKTRSLLTTRFSTDIMAYELWKCTTLPSINLVWSLELLWYFMKLYPGTLIFVGKLWKWNFCCYCPCFSDSFCSLVTLSWPGRYDF